MVQVKINFDDVDFLIEQFSRLTAQRSYRKPSEYIESVRYIDRALSPFRANSVMTSFRILGKL